MVPLHSIARLCLLGLSLCQVGAQAQEPVLRWLLSDATAPRHAPAPMADEAQANRALRGVLWPQLPGWQHQVLVRSAARIAREMRGTAATCTLHGPSAAAGGLLSGAWLRQLPVGIVVRQADAARWGPHLNWRGELVLQGWLQDPGLALAVMGDRQHGAGIDAVLQQQDAQRLRRLQLDSASRVALSMVAREQGVDATFADPVEVSHFERTQTELLGRLRWLPVQGQPEIVPAALACSRNEAGRRALAQIDALLVRADVREQLQALYEARLLPPERERLMMLRSRMGAGFWRELALR